MVIQQTHLGRGLAELDLPVLLAVGHLPVEGLVVPAALDEGHVVVVGAGGARQDAHEVTVVAQVLQQAGHPPESTAEHRHRRLIHDPPTHTHTHTHSGAQTQEADT